MRFGAGASPAAPVSEASAANAVNRGTAAPQAITRLTKTASPLSSGSPGVGTMASIGAQPAAEKIAPAKPASCPIAGVESEDLNVDSPIAFPQNEKLGNFSKLCESVEVLTAPRCVQYG